jgi:hypothetical protein
MAGGRPPALNPEREAALLNAIKTGVPLRIAASYSGVDERTVKQWRSKGEAALHKKASDRSGSERLYAGFVTHLDEALSYCATQAQALITSIIKAGMGENVAVDQQRVSLQAAQFVLTHRFRDDYTTRSELTGKDGAPLEMSAGEAWDKLLALTGREAESPEPDDDGEDAEIVRIA